MPYAQSIGYDGYIVGRDVEKAAVYAYRSEGIQ